jgi:DNA-binding transcriptional MerR regulator
MSMNIGELVRASDTKVETIRYYERIGLLPPPPRTAGNYRNYSVAHANRLSFIRRAGDLDFSIEQMARPTLRSFPTISCCGTRNCDRESFSRSLA